MYLKKTFHEICINNLIDKLGFANPSKKFQNWSFDGSGIDEKFTECFNVKMDTQNFFNIFQFEIQ